ncbi:MAG: hypothetical protein D6743_17210 [Calditrichaeota bacterium]|nr:MAG: hypothetical protein D6743_17210 [Calditrichota bacterium]
MIKLIRRVSLLALLLFGAIFIFSGCYTQLAKPETAQGEKEYEVEEHYGQQDRSEEYYEGEEEEGEYGGQYEEEQEEDYEDVHVTRRYYFNNYYYGAWAYDPFFSPFFYDPFFYDPFFYDPLFFGYYPPYSSHVFVHVGFYDPYFYGFYDPFFYGFGFNYGFAYFGFGHRFFPGFHPVHFSRVNVHTTPFKRRSFSRRGTRHDDFGYEGGRRSTHGSDGSDGAATSTATRRRVPRDRSHSLTDEEFGRSSRFHTSTNKFARRHKRSRSNKEADTRNKTATSQSNPNPEVFNINKTMLRGSESGGKKSRDASPRGLRTRTIKRTPKVATRPTRLKKVPKTTSKGSMTRARRSVKKTPPPKVVKKGSKKAASNHYHRSYRGSSKSSFRGSGHTFRSSGSYGRSTSRKHGSFGHSSSRRRTKR